MFRGICLIKEVYIRNSLSLMSFISLKSWKLKKLVYSKLIQMMYIFNSFIMTFFPISCFVFLFYYSIEYNLSLLSHDLTLSQLISISLRKLLFLQILFIWGQKQSFLHFCLVYGYRRFSNIHCFLCLTFAVLIHMLKNSETYLHLLIWYLHLYIR